MPTSHSRPQHSWQASIDGRAPARSVKNHVHLLRPRPIGNCDEVVQRKRRWYAPDDEVFEHLRRQISVPAPPTLARLRVNAQNFRKEFFRVTLDEVESALKRLAPDAPFFKDIEAQEYNETLSRRRIALEAQSESQAFPASL